MEGELGFFWFDSQKSWVWGKQSCAVPINTEEGMGQGVCGAGAQWRKVTWWLRARAFKSDSPAWSQALFPPLCSFDTLAQLFRFQKLNLLHSKMVMIVLSSLGLSWGSNVSCLGCGKCSVNLVIITVEGSDAISAFISEFESVCLKNGLRLLGPDNDRSSLHSCNVNGHSQKRAVDPRIYFILCLISNLFIF